MKIRSSLGCMGRRTRRQVAITLLFLLTPPVAATDLSREEFLASCRTDVLARFPDAVNWRSDGCDARWQQAQETMPLLDSPPTMRRGDPFLDAVFAFVEPVFELLGTQDVEATKALSVTYPAFRDAHAAGKVGHHFMVARSDALPKADAFELVAATAARYRTLGHAFVVIEATNQWTGAACEALTQCTIPFTFRPPWRDSGS